jgi:hypothetical protein
MQKERERPEVRSLYSQAQMDLLNEFKFLAGVKKLELEVPASICKQRIRAAAKGWDRVDALGI